MDFITEYGPQIMTIIGTVASMIVAITSFVKSLKSETRTLNTVAENRTEYDARLKALAEDVKVTRAGIVQGFKEAVVTKDVKVSVNSQVKKILDEKMQAVIDVVKKNEEKRTKMTYWMLKILRNTAAADKLTVEQQSEVDEVMAMIAEDETIIDTLV